MKYRLVLQWPSSSMADYNRLIELEDIAATQIHV
jgi:hypothetical protein